MQRRTIIVDGPLAFRMRRIEAARSNENGVEILTLPLLAARLAGGFVRPASAADVEAGLRAAFEAGAFRRLTPCRDLPGAVRAASRVLRLLWDDGRLADAIAPQDDQIADVALIESRVRQALPAGVMLAPDLAAAARARVSLAARILGAVELDRVFSVAPVWRPLLNDLVAATSVLWRNAPNDAVAWFAGACEAPQIDPAPPTYVACANVRAEAVEALRWAHRLLATGETKPGEIAIVAATAEAWDDHFLALARSTRLPLHFAHGRPALASEAGQACAALADMLLRGLNQDRFRRLVSYGRGRAPSFRTLEKDWADDIPRAARLGEAPQWRAALDRAAGRRAPGIADAKSIVLPAVELLASGRGAAAEAGAKLLPPEACALWHAALQRAPASALEQSLRDLRLADDVDPGAAVAWGPATIIAGAPRPHMRLLGLAARSWPRRRAEDPFLGHHIADAAHNDSALFAHLLARASASCVISRSRRTPEGGRLAASPLVAAGVKWDTVSRDRRPEHAFSEADRLFARPSEAAQLPSIKSATTCWRNSRKPMLTPHDGRVRANHPAILSTLNKPQSATSLRVMLRDPLAYVWRYALGWRAPDALDDELGLNARDYGILVHELLARAVRALEPEPGFARASSDQVARELNAAARELAVDWPLQKATPPALLWAHTLDCAVAEARRALRLTVAEGTRSWTEVGFGQARDDGDPALPWRPDATVTLAKSGLRLSGVIDRLDRNASNTVRVTDYKTGRPPQGDDFLLRGGLEVQRIVYTIAVRQLMPDVAPIYAQLHYTGADGAKPILAKDMDAAPFEAFAAVAAEVLKRGDAISGDEAFAKFYDLKLMLPAWFDHASTKRQAREETLSDLSPVWEAR